MRICWIHRVGALLLAATAFQAQAQDFPNRSITMVMP